MFEQGSGTRWQKWFLALRQESAQGCPPQTKSSPLSVFVNAFYWHIATAIHLYIVPGCFWTTVAQRSSGDRDWMAFKASNIYYVAIYRSLLTLVLRHHIHFFFLFIGVPPLFVNFLKCPEGDWSNEFCVSFQMRRFWVFFWNSQVLKLPQWQKGE